MPSSKTFLLALLFAPMAWAGQPWDASETGWLVPDAAATPARASRPAHPPEYFSSIQADGNFVPPRYPLGDELKLMDAVRAMDVKAVRALLKAGTSPSVQDYGRDSPLLIAVRNDHPELVQLLLDAGAHVNVRGRGFTPLGLAVRQNSVLIVRMLLRAGADPNLRNIDGDTALHSAVRMKHRDVAAAVARAKPDFSLFDREGLSALALAVTSAQYDMADILVRAGAPLEIGNKYSHTPLWLASTYSDQEMVRLLLKLGANPAQIPAEKLN